MVLIFWKDHNSCYVNISWKYFVITSKEIQVYKHNILENYYVIVPNEAGLQ